MRSGLIALLSAALAAGCVVSCQAQPPGGGGGAAKPSGADAGSLAGAAMKGVSGGKGGGAVIGSAIPAALAGAPVALPQFPSISPDGQWIVFSYAGDLWSVPAAGGVAERLTAHPSDELRSAFSPDGKWLAFESERDGPRNIYVMPLATSEGGGGGLAGGAVRRVTVSDRAQALSGFSADGKSVLFSSNHEPTIFRSTRMYRAAVEGSGGEGGGSVMERISDAFGASPHETADGAAVLFHRGRYDLARPNYVGAANPDVYRLDKKSGAFTRLTSDPHSDGEAFGLPDGSVVFVSSRDGENNLWRLKAGGAESSAVQLTKFAPTKEQVTIGHGVRDLAVAPGGTTAVFCVWDTMYTLDLSVPKAEPRPVKVGAGGDFALLDFQRVNLSRQVTDAALSPDGKTVAVVARGEVFIRSTEKDRPTRHVTAGTNAGHARATDVAWSPDGRVLYVVSDASGRAGIYAATVAMSREDLTPEDKTDAKPDADAEKPKAEPGDKPDSDKAEATKEPPVEKAEGEAKPAAPAKKKEKKPDHGKRWADAITFKIEPVLVASAEQRKPAPSPDGKRLMFVRGLGDIVIVEVADGMPKKDSPERVLLSSWDDPTAFWVADSRHVIYEVQDFNYNSDIWLVDALADAKGGAAGGAVNLTRHPDFDHGARLSADGKVLYFLSDRDANSNGQDDVFAINLDRKLDGLRPYELADYYKDAADKAKKRRPLGAPAAPVGAGGGGSGRGRSGAGGGADTAPAKDGEAKDDKPAEETKKEAPPSPEHPLTFDADDAYLRVHRVVSGVGDIGTLEATPGGERVLFTATIDGTTSLLSTDYLGKDRKTAFAGGASSVQCSLGGDKVLFVSGGAAARDPGGDAAPRRAGGGEAYLGKPAGGETEKMSIDAPVTIDIAAQQKQKFLEAARLMGDHFYHPTLKGLDWAGLTRRYVSLAVQTRTDGEFNRVFSNLLGELEGSHMGISGGRDQAGTGQPIGYLGIDVERVAGGFRIKRVVAHSPADSKGTRLVVGEVIVAINGKATAPAPGEPPVEDLNAAMAGTSGQETLVDLKPAEDGKPVRHVLITPAASGAETNLRYQDEVHRNAALVDRLSGGKLGYLHIRAMDMASVRDYERDVFAAADGKLGLIIDVRDNGGGSTTDILLSSLTAPRHAYTAARGVDLKTVPKDAYPRDRRLIYAYNRAISVLINCNSYSNAEIFAHSIKTIGRGKLVGQQTFGAVISTGSHTLIDGTTIRTPFRGWYLPDGTDMENHGAEPDVPMAQTPEDEVAGRDPQLEAAVKELLTRAKAF